MTETEKAKRLFHSQCDDLAYHARELRYGVAGIHIVKAREALDAADLQLAALEKALPDDIEPPLSAERIFWAQVASLDAAVVRILDGIDQHTPEEMSDGLT